MPFPPSLIRAMVDVIMGRRRENSQRDARQRTLDNFMRHNASIPMPAPVPNNRQFVFPTGLSPSGLNFSGPAVIITGSGPGIPVGGQRLIGADFARLDEARGGPSPTVEALDVPRTRPELSNIPSGGGQPTHVGVLGEMYRDVDTGTYYICLGPSLWRRVEGSPPPRVESRFPPPPHEPPPPADEPVRRRIEL